ncbi:MAG: hypothetical protein UT84_C0004G0023 [Candidatus Curtissbacteria bacterium GW2011_GWA1_40_16]|uniref:Uncharacterized protein n=1 Tax=Candidatus Curtissbacteria bacterium GW2011_GWA1_40_16 TaxID=1618405 RepID=A0A0G0TV59_9BACT|nr:MAG: hypothetical protein UT84_C0004G0023 [Candidatus Curtissbacteria bacterium GW2011_GWA1_40_16]
MEQSLASKILAKIGLAILVVALFDLALLNWWMFKKSPDAASETASGKGDVSASAPPIVSLASPSSKPLASEAPEPTNQPQPTSPPQAQATQTIVKTETQTIIQTPQKEIFIPLGSGSTKSGSFSDLGGVEVSIDTTKYPPIDYMVFQASIWVTNGNGKAWARVINVNDNNPFYESEISSSSSSGEFRTSGKIPFVYGPKTYRVQAKTDITDFAANISNAMIKIVLK